jgi:uncharacterized protein involved in exopolysaccharide biosynthesis
MTTAVPPSMTVSPARLLRLVVRRIRLFAAMLVVAPVVAVGLSQLVPKTWKAQARVLVQDSSQVNPLLEDLIVPWKVNNRVPIMTSVLKSDRTTRAVLGRLGKLDGLTPEQRDLRTRAFKARVDAFAVGGGLVAISLTASTPLEAREGLQALVDEFVEEMLRPQKQSVAGSATFLSEQLARLRAELQTLEDQLTIYKTDNANELPEVYKLNLDTWLGLRKQLTDVEVRLQGATRRRALLEERLQLHNPVARAIEAQLVELQTTLRERRATWRDDAPEVLELQRQIAALGEQLREARAAHPGPPDLATLAQQARATLEVDDTGEHRLVSADPITGELFAWKQARDDEEGARAERELLRARVDDAERAVRSFARNEASLNRLNRDFETKSAVYRSLLEKYEDALITRELSAFNESAQVWIVDPPVLPTLPQNPPTPVVLLGALFGGQVIAFLLALLLELLAGTCADSGEAARRLGVDVVCIWPWQPGAADAEDP